jgi:outer membrane autotransporter protein
VNGGTAALNIATFTDTVGTVTVAGGGAITGTSGVLTSTGTFEMQSGSVSAILNGAAALNKTTGGTVTLSGNNTYTGLTTINAGTLAYGQSVSSASAHTNNGTLALGTNTLTLAGASAYTQNAGSTLDLTINSDNTSGNMVVGGATTVNAASTVHVTVPTGVAVASGTPFTIINTSGLGDVLAAPAATSSTRKYAFAASVNGGGDLIVTSAQGSYAAPAGATGNEAAVGNVLTDVMDSSGDMGNVLDTLGGLSDAEYTDSLSTMTPDVSSGTAEGSRALSGNSFRMISNRLGGARNVGGVGTGVSSGDITDGMGVWMQGLGSHMKQDERKGIEGFSANTFGTTIGLDKVIDNHFRLGLAGGYGWAGVHSKTPGSPSDNINSFQGTVYGSYDSLDLEKARQGGKKSYEAVRSQVERSWYVDGMAAFAQDNYDSRREIWLGTDRRVAKADHHGQQYSTNFESGYKFVFEKTKALEVTPFASLGYNYLYMNKYKESGANALNLSVQGEGFHQLEQGLGAKLAYPMVAKKVGTFIPSAKAAWLYDYIGDQFETTASFAGGGPSFNTQGAKPAKSGMLFGAELAFLNKGNMTVTGNWDIELRDQYMSNTYYGIVRYDF